MPSNDAEQPFVLDPEQAVWEACTQPSWCTEPLGVLVATTGESPPTSPESSPDRQLVEHCVQWTGAPYVDRDGTRYFLKVIDWGVYSAQVLREMTAAHAALQAAFDDPDYPPPPAIVPTQLLFGNGRLLIRSPFLAHYESLSSEKHLTTEDTSSPVVKAVADALEWLVWHGVLYTDMRPPNVMVLQPGALTPVAAGSSVPAALATTALTGGTASASATARPAAAKVIDYDDCKHIPGLRASLLHAAHAHEALEIVHGHLVRYRAVGYRSRIVWYTMDGYFRALPALLKAQLWRRIVAANAKAVVPPPAVPAADHSA